MFITFVWGSTFVLVKNALLDAAPLTFNAVRFGSAAIILAVIFRGAPGESISRQTLLAGIGVGLCLCAGYQFQNLGLRLTTPSKSAFLTGISCRAGSGLPGRILAAKGEWLDAGGSGGGFFRVISAGGSRRGRRPGRNQPGRPAHTGLRRIFRLSNHSLRACHPEACVRPDRGGGDCHLRRW